MRERKRTIGFRVSEMEYKDLVKAHRKAVNKHHKSFSDFLRVACNIGVNTLLTQQNINEVKK